MKVVSHKLVEELRRRVAQVEGFRPPSVQVQASSEAQKKADPTNLQATLLGLGYGSDALPQGRLVELMGPRSCGKRAWVLRWMAERSRAGSVLAWIDGVGGLHAPALSRLGFDLDRLVVVEPTDIQRDLYFVLSTLARCPAISWVVADVGAAVRPRWRSDALQRLSVYARRGATQVWLLRDEDGRVPEPAWWGGVASLRLRAGRGGALLEQDALGSSVFRGMCVPFEVERSRPPLPGARRHGMGVGYEERVDGEASCLHLSGGAADPGVPV